MSFKEPTYEEYKTATAFAKFRYKFGMIVLILCWISLLFICYYMVTKGEAISRNPLAYGADKYNVECRCYNYSTPNFPVDFFVNGSAIWTTQSLYENINISNINISKWELKK